MQRVFAIRFAGLYVNFRYYLFDDCICFRLLWLVS